MMDKSEVLEILDVVVPAMKDDLFLKEWRIRTRFESLDENCPAEVWVDSYYKTATIKLDLNDIDSLDQLIEIYRHEIFHVAIYPVDEYRRLTTSMMSKTQRKAAREMYAQVQERMVTHLENMFDLGFKITCERYIKLWRDHAGTEENERHPEEGEPQSAPGPDQKLTP